MSFTLTGHRTMITRLKTEGNKLTRKSRKATRDEAMDLLKLVQNKYVPKDKLDLHDSGRVDDTGTNQFQAQSRVSFSGPHAIPIHELPQFNPPTWDGTNVHFRVGGPKYLEKGLRERASGMASRVGQVLKL